MTGLCIVGSNSGLACLPRLSTHACRWFGHRGLMNSLPHCQLSHMTPMNRPAGIEPVLGGNIAMAYRDDLGICRNRIVGTMRATFR